jgi:hypothetical protein
MFRAAIRNLLSILPMNGDHVVNVNGHKFKFSARDIVYGVCLCLSIVGIYFSSTNRIDRNGRSIEENDKRDDAQDAKIASMDTNGTHRSHEIDTSQQQTLDYHTKQLDQLNNRFSEFGPKLDKLDQNVLWLMGKQLEGRK